MKKQKLKRLRKLVFSFFSMRISKYEIKQDKHHSILTCFRFYAIKDYPVNNCHKPKELWKKWRRKLQEELKPKQKHQHRNRKLEKGREDTQEGRSKGIRLIFYTSKSKGWTKENINDLQLLKIIEEKKYRFTYTDARLDHLTKIIELLARENYTYKLFKLFVRKTSPKYLEKILYMKHI